LENYQNVVDPAVLEGEIKKVKDAYIRAGHYKELGGIIAINKKYGLTSATLKIQLLYLFAKLFPSSIIHRLVNSLS